MIQEWDLPAIGVFFAQTPAGGEDALMLDYRHCSQEGEPRVVYVNEDRDIIDISDDFEGFLRKLQVKGPPL